MNPFFRRTFITAARLANTSTDSIVSNIKENRTTYGIFLGMGLAVFGVLEKFKLGIDEDFKDQQKENKEHRREILDSFDKFKLVIDEDFKGLQKENKQFQKDQKESFDRMANKLDEGVAGIKDLLNPILVDVQVNKREIKSLKNSDDEELRMYRKNLLDKVSKSKPS